jgi:hypothetical protein
MTIDTPKTAGDDVESRCLKCKAVTSHTIIAITGDVIAKVQCNTCDARHNYRPPVTEKKKKSITRRRRNGVEVASSSSRAKAKTNTKTCAGKRIATKAVNFEALIQGKDVNTALPYALDVVLSAGDLISHSIFGLGVVTELVPVNKAYIAFRDHGTKLMACRKGPC